MLISATAFTIDLPEAAAITGRVGGALTSITAFLVDLVLPIGREMDVPSGLEMVAPTGLAMVITGRMEATTTTTILGGITQPMATPGWQSVPMCTPCHRTACMSSTAA
jgi:hypothetical protein